MRVSVNLNAQKPDTTTNAVIYARYSSHGQTEQSIEGQLAKGHEYAAAQGYTVVHEYIDRAMTGRNDNREAFQKMLSDTGKHQFQVVIVWKVDRFGRNREEIAFNKHTCKKNGVRVEYVAESLPNSPEAVILESVLEGMAEYYSIQLSQNIRRGQLESAKKCQCVGGSVPLGYTLDSDKHFVIDPQTAPVVKKIFDLYAEGATISEITGQLNEQGIRTARKQLFTKNSLTKLLKNEKYIGVYTYKDIVRVEGGVPAIVDESTFDRVQELLKINRRAPSHTWTKVEYLLTDKLFCGHCGSPMVGESGFSHTGAKYSYYGCIKRRREKACDKKPVRQDWIEALVLDETVKLLHDDELMEYIIDRTWEYYQVTDKVQEEKAVLEAQLAEVDKAINNLVRAIEAGIFNAATKSRMDELDAQKAALTASLADLELTSGIRITRDHIEYFLLRLRDLDVKDRECQKRLVQTFVNAVFIYDDGRVKITYNYSGQSSTIALNQIASAEKGKGFVCCLPCSCSAGEPDVTQTQPVPSISPTNTPDENTVLPGLDDDIILPDGGRNDSTTREATGVTSMDKARRVIEQLEEELERLSEVEEAHVIIAGHKAAVALTFDDQYKAGIDDRFRKIVRERIDGVIGGIDTVALTTDKTVMDALEALQDRLDSVSDMSSLQAELDKILETMNAASRAKA